ncbi:sulfate transporter [Wenjunlia vitaminophila]|uniref:Anti-sigma factor antagonist n=1 Tax=Wenjunlia vitaminophila TaxID=76728 RepID=A0A0T6LP01_WENVI|nr:STAS domain-containing protein [Wenjunlia vitaminophila]KRV47749.1 sulfate transporter [Wenjunlia vitaminophila]
MSDDQPTSRIRERLAGETVVVEVSGEVDALAAPRLISYLDSLTTRDRPDVVLDLRRVTFLDCSGLTALVRARNRALARSGRVRLVCDDPFTLRTLRVTRLAGHFTILPDASEFRLG